MSRTDIHRPWWVLMNDPTIRHWYKDFHDHSKGICDLEQYLADSESMPFYKWNCTRQQWTAAPHTCGCGMCTERYWRRCERRKERAAGKRECRDLRKLRPGEID